MLIATLLLLVCLLPDLDYSDNVPHSRFPGVLVSDGMEFAVDAHSAKSTWREAREHVNRLDGYMQTYYYPNAYRLWRQEAEWARDCWDLLDNYHEAKITEVYANRKDSEDYRRERKLYALLKLKELLGDEAYNARWMPPPIPVWLK